MDQEPRTPIGLITQLPNKLSKICELLAKENTVPELLSFDSRAHGFLEHYQTIKKALETKINIDVDCIGFESFLQEDLNGLNKGTTVEQNLQTVEKLRKLGANIRSAS